MKYLLNLLLFASLISISSCSSEDSAESGKGAVNIICDCFLDAGIENEYDVMSLENDEKKTKEIMKCVLPVLKSAYDELDDMNDEDRAAYFADAIKASVDCECGHKLLLIAAKMYEGEAENEFANMIDEIEWLLDKSGGFGKEKVEEGTEEYYYEEACGEGDYYEPCGEGKCESGDYYEDYSYSTYGSWSYEDKQKAYEAIEEIEDQLDVFGDKKQDFIDCYLGRIEDNYSSFASADADLDGCSALAEQCASEVMDY